jgi:hypothetical protein
MVKWRTLGNVKINFVDFIDENIDVDYDDYNFASVNDRDRFGQNES